jgi:hypothetical protein
MNAELEGNLDQLFSIRQDAPGIVARLSIQQANWRPAPNRWSIAECFSHLNLSAAAVMRTLDDAIAQGRAGGVIGTGPAAYPLWERLFAQSLEPPPWPRVRTIAALAPAREQKPEDVLHEFLEWQDRFAERVRGADGLDLRHVRARSPVSSWLRYSLGTAFRVFLAHERRHLWQARHVRQELDHRPSTIALPSASPR